MATRNPLGAVDGVKKTASGKASTVRDVNVSQAVVKVGKDPIALRTTVKEFQRFSLLEKSYKEQKEEKAGIIRTFVGSLRDTNALAGDYQKSYRLVAEVKDRIEKAVTVSQVDKFSLPKKDGEMDDLKDFVGDEFFDENFEKVTTIAIKKSILNNKEKRRELSKILAEALGKEGMKKYFEKSEVWTVKDGLDQRQYQLEDKLTDFRAIVKPSKDSVSDSTTAESGD